MSKTISCPFCHTALTIDENASMVVCLSCGKGFALGVSAQSGTVSQLTQAPQSHGFVPLSPTPLQNHGFVPPPLMPPYQAMQPQIERRRPGNGLFVTGIVINSLVIFLSCVELCMWSLAFFGITDSAYLYDEIYFCGKIVFVILAFIINLVSIAKYWSLLPNQFRRNITPGGAAGFMLIPFFNLYWILALHLRLGTGLQQAAKRSDSVKGCGIATAILIFVGSVSYIKYLIEWGAFRVSVLSVLSLPSRLLLYTLPDNRVLLYAVFFLLSGSFGLILQSIGYLIALCRYQKAAKIIEP